MQKILRRETETISNPQLAWGISLDMQGSILSIELISRQGLDEHTFLPAQILNVPIQKQAAGFVLIHNHAAGQLEPTESDKAITARLIHCGSILQMPLLDHLIIDGDKHYSFRDAGLMDQLERDSKYDHPVRPEEVYEREVKYLVKEKDKLTLHVASLMHESGYPIEAIMVKTGLSLETILNITMDDEEEDIDPDSHFETTGN